MSSRYKHRSAQPWGPAGSWRDRRLSPTARRPKPLSPSTTAIGIPNVFGTGLNAPALAHSATVQPQALLGYDLPLSAMFRRAANECPSVSIDPEIMAGAPCIASTRIPVYMILDAIEYYGCLEGAVRSYPRLTAEQVKDAVCFAKLVVECPIDDEAPFAAR